MPSLPIATVDVETPNGERIALRPVVPLERLPGLSRGGLAAVAVVCFIFLLTSTNRLNHTDLWGHLNFGRWIVNHRSLPTTDPFRADRVEHFVNIPWLAQVWGYGCHQALGLEGLVLGHALLVALTAMVLIVAVRARDAGAGCGALAAGLAYVLALPIVGTIRPQLFGMLAFALTLYGISLLPTRRSVLLWLPVVFGLWANLHGSFAMGLIALGCYALAAMTPGTSAGAKRDAWAALLLAVGAACVNPYGFRLLGSVVGFSGNANLEGISEWRPMTLGSLSGILFYSSLLLTAIVLRLSPRRISVTEVLLLLAFGLIAVTAIRMLVWWALVCPWIVAPHVAALWALRTKPVSVPDPAAGLRRWLFALLTIGLTIWWSPPTHALCTRHPRAAPRVLSTDTPEDLAEWMCRHQIHGRITAPMDWADYLIWRTRGAVEPLVHSHVHVVSPAVWQDFLAVDRGRDDWLAIAERHGLRYLVVSRSRNRQLLGRLAGNARCRLVHEDRQALVFQLN